MARWDRAETVLGPYDFHTNHTSVPYLISSSPGPVDMIGIEVPKTSVNLPWDRVQKVIGQALSQATPQGFPQAGKPFPAQVSGA